MADFSDRQVAVLKHVADNPGCDAASIGGAIHALGLGTPDARGAAQTVRRLPAYVKRSADAKYTLTALGRKKVSEL